MRVIILVAGLLLLPRVTLGEADNACCCCTGAAGIHCVTATASVTNTVTRTGTITNTPTRTSTPTSTRTATATPASTSTFTNTPTVTSTPTATGTNTATATITPTPAGFAPANLSSCMVAVWEMEESTGATRLDSAGTSCGTDCNLNDVNSVVKDTTNKVTGTASGSYTASSSQDLECNITTTCEELNFTTSGDLSWFCFARTAQDTVNQRIMVKANSDYGMFRSASLDAASCQIVKTDNTSVFADGSSNEWAAGTTWHLITCIYKDSTDQLFERLDGAAAGTDSSGATSIRDSSGTVPSFAIGRAGSGGYWDGQIDTCGVYRGLITDQTRCFVCSCGVNGELCTCDSGSPTSYSNAGRRVSNCNSCTLPSCNASASSICGAATPTNTPVATSTPTNTSATTSTSTSTSTATSTATPTPVSVSFDASCSIGDCATVSNASGAYPPAGIPSILSNFLNPSRTFSGGAFQVQLGLIRWNTASIPDGSTILTCQLEIKTSSETPLNDDSRNLTAAWATAEVPWSTTDYDVNAGTDALAGTSLGTFTNNTVYDLSLSACSNVDDTGYTGLKLWVDGGQPTSDNLIDFKTITPFPKLLVTYTP